MSNDGSKKSIDEFLVNDIEKLSNNEIKMNVKALLESYMSQGAIAEKLLLEFTKTRRIIELFLMEYFKRGESIDDLSKDLGKISSIVSSKDDLDKSNENSNSIKNKTSVRFKETKVETGETF
jgi:hypothetical protein